MTHGITVIIPVYNAAAFLEKAVNSCIQFSEVREILLIDDGSQDDSLQIAHDLSKEFTQIKVLQHPDKKNHGVSATRNLGIDRATQEFITFLDADDYWLPNRFDAERKIFKDPKVDGVFGALDTEFVTEEGKKQYLAKFGGVGLTTVNFPAEGKDIFYGLIGMKGGFGSFFSMIALTVRRSALENLRLDEKMGIGEDKEFTIKLAWEKNLKTGIIDRPVAIRTGHENNSITKVTNYSTKFFHHNALLYESLYKWSCTKKDMPADVVALFKNKYLSNRIAAASGLKKYRLFITSAVFNPALLKTRYRYYALKNNKK